MRYVATSANEKQPEWTVEKPTLNSKNVRNLSMKEVFIATWETAKHICKL